jgi:hypothetical protein
MGLITPHLDFFQGSKQLQEKAIAAQPRLAPTPENDEVRLGLGVAQELFYSEDLWAFQCTRPDQLD